MKALIASNSRIFNTFGGLSTAFRYKKQCLTVNFLANGKKSTRGPSRKQMGHKRGRQQQIYASYQYPARSSRKGPDDCPESAVGVSNSWERWAHP